MATSAVLTALLGKCEETNEFAAITPLAFFGMLETIKLGALAIVSFRLSASVLYQVCDAR